MCRVRAGLVQGVDGGVTDDQLVSDGVVIDDPELHDRVRPHPDASGGEPAVLDVEPDSHPTRSERSHRRRTGWRAHERGRVAES